MGERRREIGEVSLKIQNYVALLAHLTEGAVSAQDLADLTGLHVVTTRDFLKEMHKRKLVHIAQWDTKLNRRIKLPMYKLGEGGDKPRPPRLSSAETTKRYKERQKLRAQFDPFYALCRPVAVSREADRV
jgi:predicted ArsR family transcriptional regulator